MALTIATIDPANEATQITAQPVITITFNSVIDQDTVDDASIVLAEIGTAVVSFELTDGGIGTQDIYDIVPGTIVVNSNIITFTPTDTLKLGATYSILVSSAIANTSDETLGSIYASTFTVTNTSNDIVNETSVNLLTTNANIGDQKFRVISTSPAAQKILKTFDELTEFKFIFSEDIDDTTVADGVEVYFEALLDDTEEEFENIIITVADNVLTIKTNHYDQTIPDESVLLFRLLGSIKSVSGKYLDAVDYSYILTQSPFYIPVKLFKLKAGQLINNIQDLTLIALIAYFSDELDNMNERACGTIPDPIKQAYVFYSVLYHLMTTTRQAPPNSVKKALADFVLEIENKVQADTYNRCLKDAKQSLELIKLYLTTHCGSNLFIKSVSTIDYPANVGRNNYYDEITLNPRKVRVSGSRRSKWYN